MSYIENNWDNVNTSASGPDILTGYEPNFRYIDYVKSNMVDGEEKRLKTLETLRGHHLRYPILGV